VAELPSGTVTFLFTDIEGSTHLWQEHPEAMRPALARHDELLREAIESHDGHVVKTTGDGAHAVFATATDAIAAAVSAQRAVAAEAWPERAPLVVRMGIHSGPAELRDGDYYGTAVNKAARLMSVAHGGQIVVSLATEELAGDELDGDLSLRDLGEHRLRDLSRAERVYQVEAAGLAAAFPSLRGLDAYAGNLPVQLTSFVGREEDVASIADDVRCSRMVTLTGVGGVGKTRLSLQVAAELVPDFPDGVWFFELAPVGDEDAALQAIATVLGVSPRPGLSTERAILDFFALKRALVVLDNCEHLLDATATFAEHLLHDCPGVHVLATSREALTVESEHIRSVRSIQQNDAERLFVERAAAVTPAFGPGDQAATVSEICRRLDGIPLAIELAAARVESMTPSELAQLLDERFRLLTGGRRTAAKRHQTLRATVDWSYSMLDDTDRDVFDRLSVFAGSFDAAAAIAVASDDGLAEWGVRDALARLVRRSMVNADPDATGSTRYSLLETLKEYASEQLHARGEVESRRRLHAQHFASLAATCGPKLRTRDELAARREILSDIDNLRAALEWAASTDDPDDHRLGITIAAELAPESWANTRSGIGRWSIQMAPFADTAPPGYRHAILGTAAYVSVLLDGDFEAARAFALDALTDGVPPDSPTAQLAHTALASVSQFTGDLESAVAWMDAGLPLFARTADPDYFVSIGRAVKVTASLQIDPDAAERDAEAALELARTTGNPSAVGLALFVLGFALHERDPERALVAFDESIALSRAGAVDGALGAALAWSATLRVGMGDVGVARESLTEALQFSDSLGDRGGVGNSLLEVVDFLTQAGDARLATWVAASIVDGAMAAPGRADDRKADVLAQAGAELDPVERDAVWAAGAAATYTEVLETVVSALADAREVT
jgi:predicted ATPase/class 3 adenylate cyclase